MATTAVKVTPNRVLTFAEIVHCLAPVLEKSPAEYAILFGSYAREGAQPSSDVDLLVVSDADFPWHNLQEACPVGLDLLIKDTATVNEKLGSRSLLFEIIAEEGRVVYNREPNFDPIRMMVSKRGKDVTDLQQKINEANILLEKARRSWEGVEGFVERKAYDWACFLNHQTTEFSLKALSLYQGNRGTFHSHNLSDLLNRVREKYPELVQFEKQLSHISKYYTETRYHNFIPGLEETKEAAKIARQIYSMAREQVPHLSVDEQTQSDKPDDQGLKL